MGCSSDLRDRRRAESPTGGSRRGDGIFHARRTIARAPLSGLAEKRGDSESTPRNARERKSIRQRPRKLDSSDAKRLQHVRRLRSANSLPAPYSLNRAMESRRPRPATANASGSPSEDTRLSHKHL